MKLVIAAIAVAAVSVSACVPTAQYPADRPNQIAWQETLTPEQACYEYNALQNYYEQSSLEPLLQIAIDAGEVRASRADLIRNGRVQLGMNETEVTCAWGRPSTVNTSVYATGVHKQYVYRSYGSAAASYVYFMNGRVDGIQN